MQNYTGVSAPYVLPETVDISIDTTNKGAGEVAVKVMGVLEEMEYL